MKYTKIIKRETKVMMIIVALLLVMVIGGTYAIFLRVNSSTNNQVVTTGTLQVTYNDSNGYINGNTYPDLVPMTDTEGLSQTGYSFSVKNTGNLPVSYKVYLYIDSATFNTEHPSDTLFTDLNSIKYNLQTNSDGNTTVGTIGAQGHITENGIDKYALYLGKVETTNAVNNHVLRLWLDQTLDTSNIGKYIYLKLEVESTVNDQETTGTQHIVTFDANGGSTPVATKVVTEGSTYGELPTPTRDGYTFKGWNGKNKLNIDVLESSPSNTGMAHTTKRTFTSNTYVRGLAYNNYYSSSNVSSVALTSNTINMIASSGYGIGFPLDNFSNRSYSLSYTANHTGTDVHSSIMFYAQDGTLLDYTRTSGDGNKNVVFSVPANTYYLVIEFSGEGSNNNVTITNVQLEEGSTATAYESYYITSSTEVVQDKNHTLTAIWEANS